MMILKIRDLPTIAGIREYILPKLFFKSSSFKSMIKFHNETGVKLTTAGAARVVGQKRQVGECLMVEASRKKSPGRVTRKRFNI